MCIIIIKQKGKDVPTEVLKTSARINPHGLGIVWLDTFKVSYHKSKEYQLLNTDRPYIAHFRYATIGRVCKENTHPFRCGNNKEGYTLDELFYESGYPFAEGGDYWTIEDDEVVWSCWDEQSEELFDPNRIYFTSKKRAEEYLEWITSGKVVNQNEK